MNIKTKYINSKNLTIEIPDICPHCHIANQPEDLGDVYDSTTDLLYTIWNCNAKICNKVFIVENVGYNFSEYFVNRFLVGTSKSPIWPKPILDLKDSKSESEEPSKFIKAYLQSLQAEAMGLDEIAGMGFRKSIEYLVKDWAIHNNPDEKDKILRLTLSQIINQYFSGDIKEILERATWLGNDHSHYHKLFEEFNISHLKELIGLVMVELDREYRKKHYIENIERRK
jgi:hypothetical protein